GEAELAALVRVIAWLAQLVLDVLQAQALVVALDGEDLAQHPFETGRGALLGGHIELEETVVGLGLHVGQRRHLDGVAEVAEVADGLGTDDALGRDRHEWFLPMQTTRRHGTEKGWRRQRRHRPVAPWQRGRGLCWLCSTEENRLIADSGAGPGGGWPVVWV